MEFRLPKMGMTMDEARVIRWLKGPGDPVSAGEAFVEVETDKSAITVETPVEGVLLERRVEEDAIVPVGTIIAVFGSRDEMPGRTLPQAAVQQPPELVSNTIQRIGPAASPAVRQRARSLGVNLADLKGTGPHGRITIEDVDTAAVCRSETAAVTAERRAVFDESAMRLAIARTTSESARIPQFFMLRCIDAEYVEEVRRLLGPTILRKVGTRPTVTDFLLLGAARALRAHPEFCVRWTDGRIERPDVIRIGLVVAVPNGLIVPTLAGLADKSLAEVTQARAEAVARAREGRLAADLAGPGVMTLSNLGPYGVDAFSALVNPGEAAALAVGRIVQEPVVENGNIQVRRRCTVTLSSDHRMVDGVAAAGFLETLGDALESREWPLL